MKTLIVLIVLVTLNSGLCQDINKKYSLQGIKEVGIEINLIVDDAFKYSVIKDESIYLEELRYQLNLAGIKNKVVNSDESDLPVLILGVIYRESSGEMDVISKLDLTQKLYFSKANKKLRCITWVGKQNVLYLRDKWNSYYHDTFINAIVASIKSFIADYLEVNGK